MERDRGLAGIVVVAIYFGDRGFFAGRKCFQQLFCLPFELAQVGPFG